MSLRMRVLSSESAASFSSENALSLAAVCGVSLPSAEITSLAFSTISSFFLPPPKRSFSPISSFLESLFAEELHRFGGGCPGLAERDEAMAVQHRLLAPQHDLGRAVDRHPRAVGAAVGEEEAALARLDLAVHARGHALGDHQVGGGVAPEHE